MFTYASFFNVVSDDTSVWAHFVYNGINSLIDMWAAPKTNFIQNNPNGRAYGNVAFCIPAGGGDYGALLFGRDPVIVGNLTGTITNTDFTDKFPEDTQFLSAHPTAVSGEIWAFAFENDGALPYTANLYQISTTSSTFTVSNTHQMTTNFKEGTRTSMAQLSDTTYAVLYEDNSDFIGYQYFNGTSWESFVPLRASDGGPIPNLVRTGALFAYDSEYCFFAYEEWEGTFEVKLVSIDTNGEIGTPLLVDTEANFPTVEQSSIWIEGNKLYLLYQNGSDDMVLKTYNIST